jgi:Skp family chaperone for outer membrane proteins
MLKGRFKKVGIAGFAAVAGVILVVTSAGAHQSHVTKAGLMPLTGISSSANQGGTKVDADAAEDAAALAAKVQAEAAEKLLEQQQKAAAEAAEAAADATADAAAENQETGDNETETETETGDTQPDQTDTAPPAAQTTATNEGDHGSKGGD